ncbi:hypothetical protein Rleg10DRAFT_5497 [Rhizobium leguminosarum bv. trifolii WSM2012]|nr:hypothetical protein Rleg10DRAFT_4486 [Rhizobium leguminosarum bv. trifolii WSM2012]EJC76809.1 hypothetical protein Rleg10DRAFT_5497 [Rhizobium leguminosarum bv. trifolii WSM2012]
MASSYKGGVTRHALSSLRLKSEKGGLSRPHPCTTQRPAMMLEITPLVTPISR